MSIGSVYETAYKGDFNQVKVRTDEDTLLVTTPDSGGCLVKEEGQRIVIHVKYEPPPAKPGRLLIHWAALGGNENLVDYLLEIGSPVDPIDDTNSTPLILASSAGRFEVVKLLTRKGANVNHKTNRGQSSLHYVCSKGHIEIAKWLIESGANVNEADTLSARPLHRAAAQGRTNIVELLLASPEILVDACDSTGSTPLHLACEEDREATACMLVKAGADVNLVNKDKKTPLDLSSPKLKNMISSIEK